MSRIASLQSVGNGNGEKTSILMSSLSHKAKFSDFGNDGDSQPYIACLTSVIEKSHERTL